MKSLKFILSCLLAIVAALAHGGEANHADAQAAQPRIETATESFELVGQLMEGELVFLIDRFDSNEPVLGGKLEIELSGAKAVAPFRPDRGDYAVTDPAFLHLLSKPGNHALLFTLETPNESDLLEGTLNVETAARDEDHRHFPWARAGAAVLAALVIAVLAIRLRRNKKPNRT